MDSSNMTFIIAAYTVTWIVLLGYLLRMAQQRNGEKSQ
jgi:CcmD family protein